MKNGGDKMIAVKSTVNLNKYYKEQLEELVRLNLLSSVTEGVNLAIENFVKDKNRELYAKQMEEAVKDCEFMERTLSAQNDFDKIENGDLGEW